MNNYITQRGNTYYFRVRIPSNLRFLFDGRMEVKKSLQTGNPRLAMRLSHHLHLVCLDSFEQMKDTMTGFGQILLTNPDGSKIKVNQIVLNWNWSRR